MTLPDAPRVPEFSRTRALAAITQNKSRMRLTANEQERRDLAVRLGLVALDRLSAEVTFYRRGKEMIVVQGAFDSHYVQTCGVTLEPMGVDGAGEFEREFVAREGGGEQPPARIVDFDATGKDDPDVVTGDTLDFGELVAEELALTIDPFPRRSDAELPARARGGSEEVIEKNNPFHILKDLK